jgi:hypothetical protein
MCAGGSIRIRSFNITLVNYVTKHVQFKKNKGRHMNLGPDRRARWHLKNRRCGPQQDESKRASPDLRMASMLGEENNGCGDEEPQQSRICGRFVFGCERD